VAHTRLVKGERTALTYKVYLTFDVWWEARVYEPYIGRSWFGLGPKVVKYRFACEPHWKALLRFQEHATPQEVNVMATRAMRYYEEYKLAWETPA